MALTAGQVILPQDLSNVFSGVGTKAYKNIGINYNNAMGKATQDASAQGFGGGPLDYTKERLGSQEGLDIGGLETGLGSGLGETGYKEALNLRNFNQQKQLADIIGDAAAPSMLQQIFSGIGGGSKAVGQTLPFLQMLNRRETPSTPQLSDLMGYGGGDEQGVF